MATCGRNEQQSLTGATEARRTVNQQFPVECPYLDTKGIWKIIPGLIEVVKPQIWVQQYWAAMGQTSNLRFLFLPIN